MAKTKTVMIIGGGKTGGHLAANLIRSGCEVRVLENRPEVSARLARELPEHVILCGDGTDPKLMEQAGIANTDVLAAVTGSDETNLVAASLAKFEYGVERVIVRVNNPRNAWLCTPEMGVDVAVNQSDLMASLIIEEMSVGDMQTLARLRQGSVEIVRETIVPDAQAMHKTIAELGLPEGCNIVAIMRGQSVIIPGGSTMIEAGDEIVAVVEASKRQDLEQALR